MKNKIIKRVGIVFAIGVVSGIAAVLSPKEK